MSSGEQGGASLFAVVMIGMVLWLMVMLVPLAVAGSVRIEVETAADAAALAAVGAAVDGRQPRSAAARLAAANGSRLVRCRCPGFEGHDFTATVTVTRRVRLPLVGERHIWVERTAAYSVGS